MPGPAGVGGGRLSEPRCAAGSPPRGEGAAGSRGEAAEARSGRAHAGSRGA